MDSINGVIFTVYCICDSTITLSTMSYTILIGYPLYLLLMTSIPNKCHSVINSTSQKRYVNENMAKNQLTCQFLEDICMYEHKVSGHQRDGKTNLLPIHSHIHTLNPIATFTKALLPIHATTRKTKENPMLFNGFLLYKPVSLDGG